MLNSRIKKMLAVLAAAACVAVLPGCAGSSGGNPPQAELPATQPASEQNETSQAAGIAEESLDGKLTVFVHMDTDFQDLIVPKYKEIYPGVDLSVDSANASDYETLLKTRLAAGDAPDIMTVWPGSRVADFAEKGYLEDLVGAAFVPRIPETINSEFSYDGKLYAMCYKVGGEGLYCNMEIFEQNGLGIPKDFEEFKSVCEALKTAGIQPLASGFKDDWVIMRYTNSAFATLGYGRTPDFDRKLATGELDYSYEGWVELFDKYRVLLDAGYFGEAILSTDSTQAIADFATGKTAMLIHTSDSLTEIRKTSPDMNLAFTAMPVNNPGETLYGMWKSGLGLSVSSDSKNKEAAKAFLELWCEPELNAKMYEANISATVLSDVQSIGLDPALQIFLTEFVDTNRFALGAHDRWPAGMSNNWKKKLQEFVGGEITTADMVDWLNSEYKSMMA